MTTLKAALQEAYFMELEEIPSEEKLSEDEALTFSSAFERKMKKLVRRADHPIRYRIAQAVACLLLAALLSGCTVLAVSPEARAAFVGGYEKRMNRGLFTATPARNSLFRGMRYMRQLGCQRAMRRSLHRRWEPTSAPNTKMTIVNC